MNKIIIDSMKLDKLDELDKYIDDLRDVLNEICVTIDETDGANEKLIVSQFLDELIVEYMKQISEK